MIVFASFAEAMTRARAFWSMLPRTFVACAVNCWMRASSRCTSADSVPWRADSEITRVTLNTVSATMAANATPRAQWTARSL